MTRNTHRSPTPSLEAARGASNLRATLARFLRSARAGATAIAAAVVTIMTVTTSALVTDHMALVDQRDLLKSAADAGGMAATFALNRRLGESPTVSDAELDAFVQGVARRYVLLNLQHLPEDRLAIATATLVVDVVSDRQLRTVTVSAEADLGGTVLSRHIPMLADAEPSGPTRVRAEIESTENPVEVVLAIDASSSMWDTLLADMPNCTPNSITRPCSIDAYPDARIAIVQRAAKHLVEILEPSADDRIAVGVVPWHAMVRLPASAAARWQHEGWGVYPTHRLYGQPYACRGASCTPPAPVEQALAAAAPEPWRGCLDSHRMGSVGTRASLPPTDEFFTAPSANAFAQAFFPSSRGAAYECMADPQPDDLAWQICYHDLGLPGNYSVQDVQRWCADADPTVLPLSTDADEIVAAIDTTIPALDGRTYSALGLLWAQRLLDHGWRNVWGGGVHPVDPLAPENENLRKAIVLLTDGEDTQCGPGRSCAGSPLGFAREDACTAIKETGTEIFVVAAMQPDQISGPLGDALRACSSESTGSEGTYAFLNNSDAETLEAAFTSIANQLRTVRRVY